MTARTASAMAIGACLPFWVAVFVFGVLHGDPIAPVVGVAGIAACLALAHRVERGEA